MQSLFISDGLGADRFPTLVNRAEAVRIRNNLSRTYGGRAARKFFRRYNASLRRAGLPRLHRNAVESILEHIGVRQKHARMLIDAAQGIRVPKLWRTIHRDLTATPPANRPEPYGPFYGTWVRSTGMGQPLPVIIPGIPKAVVEAAQKAAEVAAEQAEEERKRKEAMKTVLTVGGIVAGIYILKKVI